jgi:hypothetical protein
VCKIVWLQPSLCGCIKFQTVSAGTSEMCACSWHQRCAAGFTEISVEKVPEELSHPGRGGKEYIGRWQKNSSPPK